MNQKKNTRRWLKTKKKNPTQQINFETSQSDYLLNLNLKLTHVKAVWHDPINLISIKITKNTGKMSDLIFFK